MVCEAGPLVADIPVPLLCLYRPDEAGRDGKFEKSAHRITLQENAPA